MGRYKVHLVLHYDVLEIEAADAAELAKKLDDRDIAMQLWEERYVRPDRVVIDSFELEQPAGSLVWPREELTVDVRLYFSGIKVPVESVEAARAWLADDEHLNSALIGLGHHSELTVQMSEPAEQPPSSGRWKVTEDLLHVPQGLEGLRTIQAAMVNDKVEVLLNLHGNRHLDGIERARLHRDLDRLIDVLQGREGTRR